MAKFSGFEKKRPETLEFYQNRKIWVVWEAKMAKFSGFMRFWKKNRPETFEFYQNRRIWAVQGFYQNRRIWAVWEPKWLNLAVLKKTGLKPRIWAVWEAKMARFSGFEKNRPETLEFYQNRRIWAVWGAKVAKFNGSESSPDKSKIFEELAEPGPTLYPLISEV